MKDLLAHSQVTNNAGGKTVVRADSIHFSNKLSNAKELIIQAYYTEAFARMKKLPKLKDLLKEKKKQSNEEMLEAVKRLNAMMGGEVIGGS